MDPNESIERVLEQDSRYRSDAYKFVREALSVAPQLLHSAALTEEKPHLTGQQLCEAIRLHALNEFGYLAYNVLKSWGVSGTDDFGEIVYNLIDIGLVNKSKTDRREDFHDVYDFEQAFRRDFRIQGSA